MQLLLNLKSFIAISFLGVSWINRLSSYVTLKYVLIVKHASFRLIFPRLRFK